MDIQKLRSWFLENQRDFPWRVDHSPYRVWVSEVMLQQTQASVVIPYYLSWMDKFPSVEELANASVDDVVKAWEGLGYYSRARNLHEGARMIVQNFGGEFPDNPNDLSKIKGIGPYTVGAILSFAFHKKAAAVDGNVIRVIARYLGIDDDMAKAKNQKMLQERVYALLPDVEPWVISEALIELGATVCKKKAQCTQCPLQSSCHAALHQRVDQLPVKIKKTQYTILHRAVAVIISDNHILLQQGKKGEIMEGLFEFPYFEHDSGEVDRTKVVELVKKELLLDVHFGEDLPKESHSFTRYRVNLYPYIWHCHQRLEVEGYSWVALHSLRSLPFSSGHRRVLQRFMTARG